MLNVAAVEPNPLIVKVNVANARFRDKASAAPSWPDAPIRWGEAGGDYDPEMRVPGASFNRRHAKIDPSGVHAIELA